MPGNGDRVAGAVKRDVDNSVEAGKRRRADLGAGLEEFDFLIEDARHRAPAQGGEGNCPVDDKDIFINIHSYRQAASQIFKPLVE